MFGLENLEQLISVFSRLPPSLQVAFAVGVGIGGAGLVIMKLMGIKLVGKTESAHPLAIELAKVASELADSKLRVDLTQIVESTRVGLENRVERLISEVRATIITNEQEAKKDRAAIYERLRLLEEGLSEARHRRD